MIHLGEVTSPATITGQPTETTAVTLADSSTLSQTATLSMFDKAKTCYNPLSVGGMVMSGSQPYSVGSQTVNITPSMCIPYWVAGGVALYLIYTMMTRR